MDHFKDQKKLEDREEELCSILDNQIAQKGLIQVLIHNIQFQREIFTELLRKDSSLTAETLYKDKAFKEWEYSVEAMYWSVYEEISEKILAY